MGWKGALRSMQAEVRRQEREEQKRQREYAKQQKEFVRMHELEAAAYEVESFKNYLKVITSVHVDCGPCWNWAEIRSRPAPTEPQRAQTHQERAERELARFKPSLTDKVLRRTERKREELERGLASAVQADEAAYRRAQEGHVDSMVAWSEAVAFAEQIIHGDGEAYAEAVEDTEPFSEIESFGSRPQFTFHRGDVVSATIHVNDDSVIPREAKSLLKSGKLSVKQMTMGRFFELYQDYVCGVALRVGRELLALLPVDMVVTHVTSDVLNSATGHIERATVLSVAMPRDTVERLNFSALDPSHSMANLDHHMDFKKTKGFAVVEPIDPARFLGVPEQF